MLAVMCCPQCYFTLPSLSAKDELPHRFRNKDRELGEPIHSDGRMSPCIPERRCDTEPVVVHGDACPAHAIMSPAVRNRT